ncbi:MAG: biopolymer transporter ExbD [Opitutales bacterium]|nr:biopolymer transporter ExbD [Opitutales bacterium]MCH8540909.1 biopolymer transporter ExbD [Opitutales bacterium]
MKRFGRLGDAAEEKSEINLSPLIDMVFILLIFFLVTTVFVEETGVEVQKPEAASATPQERESIQIAITASGQVVFDGQDVGLSGVRPLVRRLTSETPRPVILLVDENAPSGLTVRVIDAAGLAGAESVSLAAERP